MDWKIFDKKDLANNDQDLFNLSVIKNMSFDRRDNPFKFNFDVIEPEESRDSAFEISPKSLILNSREI